MIRQILILHFAWSLYGTVCASDEEWAARRLACESLPNAYVVHSQVISGGVPDGNAGFKQLRRLGVQTVISVDGARPDLARAKSHGLQYVHLPHGYDGISDARRLALAKAVLGLPGPVYIHCHHGKHRSPRGMEKLHPTTRLYQSCTNASHDRRRGTAVLAVMTMNVNGTW